MKCPRCGVLQTKVMGGSYNFPRSPYKKTRYRMCNCGFSFQTIEYVVLSRRLERKLPSDHPVIALLKDC